MKEINDSFNEDAGFCEHGNYIDKCSHCNLIDSDLISSEKKEKKIIRIKTARGSSYEYLPDGRTQRYKKATGELQNPQDVLTFIPAWDVVKK